MRSLPIPSLAHHYILSLCLHATTDVDLQSRLTAASADLITAATDYDVHAKAKTLNLIPRLNAVGAVTKDELVSLYSNHMSAKGGAARLAYDFLRNAAPNKKCPLCGIGTVAVLDHHLPKAKYPHLSVVPANLVPACHFCNDTKRARFPTSQGEQTLHPYFDHKLLNNRWIKATIISGPPPVILYAAAPPTTWPLIDKQRVQRHFSICGLAITFTSNANDELAPLKERLALLESRGGTSAVQDYLIEEAASHSTRQNSWQLAMFEALAFDPWFVNGGFHSIP